MATFSGVLFGVCLSLLLMTATSAQAWQSHGTFTSDNITFIRSTITPIIASFQVTYTDSAGDEAAKNISNALNAQWDKAWNVVLIRQFTSNQSIVYGYAFRGHWLWWNSFTNKTTVIIWKDYNCKDTWASVNSEGQYLSTADSMRFYNKMTQIGTNFTTIFDDPWLYGYKLVTEMESASPTKAYTIVVSPGDVNFMGYICISKSTYGFQFAQNNNANKDGTKKVWFLIMRMR